MVRDDPTNNVPDAIFTKLGMQLHRRDQHPLGILKNAIYDYFDKTYSNKFEKFDDLCPIVSVKAVWHFSMLRARSYSRIFASFIQTGCILNFKLLVVCFSHSLPMCGIASVAIC